MRENNRNSIASMGKLAQFTTMNVIDGQAGLVNYSSLIFYSLTIDNILNIIVLLILAGVTIATLTGENGILTQAGKAKDKTTETTAIEKVQVEVLGSYGTDGNIDKNELNTNLENIDGLMLNGAEFGEDNIIESLPATVTLNGYDIEINNNGEVRKIPEIIAKMIANPKAYYGKKVTNYKDDGNTYRIFYIDTENYFGDGANTIYLKADYSGSYTSCSTLYDANQTIVREMNPLWASQRGDSERSWGFGERSAAWMCDLSKWESYCNTDKANYAVGGPSLEMYVKSYNQSHDKDSSGNDVLGCRYQTNDAPGYGYKVNGTVQNSGWKTDSDTLDYSTTYNSVYCGRTKNGTATKEGRWWLASPSSFDSQAVCSVDGIGASLDSTMETNSLGFAPLISLKSSFVPQVEE